MLHRCTWKISEKSIKIIWLLIFVLQISAYACTKTSLICNICNQYNRQSTRMLYLLHTCDISDLMIDCTSFKRRASVQDHIWYQKYIKCISADTDVYDKKSMRQFWGIPPDGWTWQMEWQTHRCTRPIPKSSSFRKGQHSNYALHRWALICPCIPLNLFLW